ncbi:DUF308 domain-containing protein [Spirilliplanes yamanashiensis]|uniref:DUF308 domain-containing protein n=1 Tax=Spirilliplanes yamanashiensis TaxID=42233 RepID=A0A8J4DJM3_9ACTN|nr:DUF308 domain-containing protein [Spirilliplanes yamanashiensis]MDP9816880.1 hypothetical protein [Spirilliplanes yamanashiensis]GIJ03464.1 hypothetical protein Sya03_28160 [Spirilliplanes yamanashiensis]
MSAGGARRGRRDNGLHAADYAAAGDVDPRVGEHLLDVLAAGGIAAYLQPSADLNPLLRTTTFPPRPTDRLFVDSTHLDVARDHLDKLSDEAATTAPRQPHPAGHERPQSDVDAEWARIVAGFHTTVDPATTPWPDAEGVPDRPAPAGPEAEQPPGLQSAVEFTRIDPHNRRRTDPPSLLDALDTFGADLPDGDDDGYTPPPPPPLPKLSKFTVAAVLAIMAGFLLFLFPGVLPVGTDFAMLLGFAGVLGGAVTLVWRLRSGDEDDENPDDGAVV